MCSWGRPLGLGWVGTISVGASVSLLFVVLCNRGSGCGWCAGARSVGRCVDAYGWWQGTWGWALGCLLSRPAEAAAGEHAVKSMHGIFKCYFRERKDLVSMRAQQIKVTTSPPREHPAGTQLFGSSTPLACFRLYMSYNH